MSGARGRRPEPGGARAGSRPVRRACGALGVAAALVLAAGPARGGDSTETAGDVLRVALPAAALALTVKRDDRDGRRQLYRSFAANVGATLLLKETVEDERPDGSGDDAFPSGHASMAFQGAAFLHRRYGIRSAWAAYVLAGFVAWSRVDAGEHDETDVVAGAALGTASAFLLADRRISPAITLVPFAEDGRVGLRVDARF